ncbi:unnamed protein product [Bursaphelenchus xylophilus]|uniref:(pine wood nematode) hypothetical protein n=1 Tax=Bursaphelenchus xylophilus TaxID=6326 RepID=A0A1I7SD25_BURXY|nr:unnamed protein product [Bursaphelenchus xylophilus]CAG9093056.1 unnamed protein product [Bursaphelenchus xylophilus]
MSRRPARKTKQRKIVEEDEEEMEIDEQPSASAASAPQETPKINHEQDLEPKINGEVKEVKNHINEDDETVVSEIPLILLRPSENQTVDRLLFNHPRPASLENCTAKHKSKVKHVEITYTSKTDDRFSDKKNVFDGQYFGESTASSNQLETHACAFYHDGKMYLVPIQNTYDMQRRVFSQKEQNEVEKAKLDDEKLAQLNAPSVANPVRIRFARQETEWQKKRREQSSNYRQQLIDQDPWINLQVRKDQPVLAFSEQIQKAETSEPAQFEEDKIPVL